MLQYVTNQTAAYYFGTELI